MNMLKIEVTAKPNAQEEAVRKIDERHFHVSVKEPPVQGRANVAIRRALAQYFGVAFSRVNILHGYHTRNKLVEIDGK